MKHAPKPGPDVDVAFLRVQSRPIPGSEPWAQLSVPCPRRGQIGLEVCIDCTRLMHVDVDPVTNDMLVVCHCENPTVRRRTLRPVAPPPSMEAADDTPVASLLPLQRLCLGAGLGVNEVATLFISRGVEHAPVVDEQSRPIGVLSRADILRWCWRESPGSRRIVREIMGPAGVPVAETASIARAAAVLVASDLDYLVVVSAAGTATGLLSARDLLRWHARAATPSRSNGSVSR